MKKKLKKIPKFKNEEKERKFWAKADSTDYFDYSLAKKVTLSKLKPSTRTISFRLPEYLLDNLKIEANKRDVPYQSFLKQVLADHLAKMPFCGCN